MFQTSALKFRPPERLLDFNCYLNQHLLVLTKAPHGFKIQPICQLLIILGRQAVILPAVLMWLFNICEILQIASENLILKQNSTDKLLFSMISFVSQTPIAPITLAYLHLTRQKVQNQDQVQYVFQYEKDLFFPFVFVFFFKVTLLWILLYCACLAYQAAGFSCWLGL